MLFTSNPRKISSLAALMLLLEFSLGSHSAFSEGSRLHLTKHSENRIEIHLDNDRDIAAFQFTLNATGGIRFMSVSLFGRTNNGTWNLSSFRLNDSTINVVITRRTRENLSAGSGAIGEVLFETLDGSSLHSINFTRVVASSPSATSLSLDLESIEWTSSKTQQFTLGQNYPNPFNPSTSIPFTLSQSTNVTVTVYDITGRQIKRITEGMLASGGHTVTWDSIDESGAFVPSGVYFIRLRVGDQIQVRKMILTR